MRPWNWRSGWACCPTGAAQVEPQNQPGTLIEADADVCCAPLLASYCPSAGGDDRSISGSSDTSDTSQSDCSIGSRLTIWTESTSNQAESAGHAGAKVPLQSPEKLLPSGQGGGSRPPSKPLRQLQEIGRQSSSDSGIATGSHSSYSGSFSSYIGSLDSNPGEDFGSVFSLPPHLGQDLSPCTCLNISGHEYQIPTSLRYLYDAPRNARQEVAGDIKDWDPPAALGPSTGPAKEPSRGEAHSETADRVPVSEHLQSPSENKSSEAPSGGRPASCCFKTIMTICSVCGGYKVSSSKEMFVFCWWKFNHGSSMTLQIHPTVKSNQRSSLIAFLSDSLGIKNPAFAFYCFMNLKKSLKSWRGWLQWQFRALMNSPSHLLVFLVKLFCEEASSPLYRLFLSTLPTWPLWVCAGRQQYQLSVSWPQTVPWAICPAA